MSAEHTRIPGLVDPHVHFREPGAMQKEDFETGTSAALAGGFIQVIDMPNNPKPVVFPGALHEKISLAQDRIYCDVGFYFGATKEATDYFEEVKDYVFGLKIYMNHTTGPLLMEDLHELHSVFSIWPRAKPIVVHAEGQALKSAISLARKEGKRLHVAHVAARKDIEMIRRAKEKGLPVTCEVTPHHLFLTDSDVADLGPFGVMKPSLKTEEDRLALWEGVDLGVVDMIATDHAPHTREEKELERPPFGVPGLETSLPLLLTAVAQGRLSLDRLVELTSANPRKIFGLPATPSSYTVIDLKKSYLIDSANLKTKCGWTPFEGMRVTGKVVRVVLRGDTVFDGENVKGRPKGKVIFSI